VSSNDIDLTIDSRPWSMAHPSNSDIGVVYVILDVSSGLHKIGITLDWERRKRQLHVGIKTRAICVIRVNRPGELERALHVKFKEFRLPQSEWFNLEESHLLEIKQTLVSARDRYKEYLLRKTSPRRPNPYSYSKHRGSNEQTASWNDVTDSQSTPRQPNPYSYSKYKVRQDQPKSWAEATEPRQGDDSASKESFHKIHEEASPSSSHNNLAADEVLDSVAFNQNFQKKKTQKNEQKQDQSHVKKGSQKNGSESCLAPLLACGLGAMAIGFLAAGGNLFVAIIIGSVALGLFLL
jgi:hypothetical protein